MEETARRHEASLVPEHGQESIILPLDVNLHERIRSLLLSRNEKRPPRTPCPTPDYVYLSRHPDQIHIGNSLAPPRTKSFRPTKIVARLETLKSLSQVMGATRFDGPAGQFNEGNTMHNRRPSTNPNMHSDRISIAEERRGSIVSGVNHNSQGDLIGGKLSALDSLNRSKSTGPKRPVKNRAPQISYTLRTVPPKTHKAVDQGLRPRAPIENGNYRSEVDSKMMSLFDHDGLSVTKDHHGPSGSAVDALHHIQGHDMQPATIPPSALPPKTSQGTLKPTASPHTPQNLLESLSDAQPNVPEVAKPILATETKDETHSIELSQNLETGSMIDRQFAKTQEPDPEPAEAQLAEILTNLLPRQNRSSSVASLRSIPLHADNAAEASEASLLPKIPFDKRDQTPKPSPVSRALSMLSNISDKSGLRTSRRRSTAKENHTAIDTADVLRVAGPPTPPTEGDENHWYRQIIGKRSSASLKHSNLTTRPSHRKQGAAVLPPNKQINTESTDDASILRRQQHTSEAFQKVIVDLESLLKEALDIAGRASSENSEMDPAPAKALHNGYRRLSTADSDDQSSIPVAPDEEDHRQGHVIVVEPDDEDLYHGHFTKARDATPFPRSLAPTRHHSAVPPPDGEDSKEERVTLLSDAPFVASPKPIRHQEPFTSTDWAMIKRPTLQPPQPPMIPPSLQTPTKEQHSFLVRDHGMTSERSEHPVAPRQRLPIQPRVSSMRLQKRPPQKRPPKLPAESVSSDESQSTSGPYVSDFKNSALQYHPIYLEAMVGESSNTAVKSGSHTVRPAQQDTTAHLRLPEPQGQEQGHSHPTGDEIRKGYSLKGRHHFEIREPHGFSLSRSHRRAPIARDWGTSRKRFVATITCLNTALLGLIIGIYAGEVPAIQYAVADDHHAVILGNVVFFLGLAITTALFWPLPLLHGRRPYTTAALTILLPLLFPQALAIDGSRNPYVATYRVGLLVPRAIAGLVMGFANINLKTTLLDLFGASLQSGNPHQEIVNEYDVRRHGGGMGVWLGIWTWCSIGSIGIGFWIGASLISGLQVSWGFWILIILTATVLLLNLLTPEVRRSAYRRSMAEVRSGADVSRRIARGEIKMHLDSTGPIWWWEEVWAGHVLCVRMLLQPGFAVLAFYLGWIYGQVVLVIVLLGALLSKYYFFHPQYVGLSIAIIPLGALLATPFQKASLFSRSRHHKQRTDSMTFEKRVTWTSHLVRRSIFMIVLPFVGMAYTLASHGPPTHFMVPIIFAGVIGFLSNLSIAECNGLIMETFDTSDLQPGMTGRPRHVLPEEIQKKRTNFSCFPRVTAGVAITQTISFCIAAAVTGWGGVVERHVGAQVATAVMAGVLLALTVLLITVLTRYKTVQIIPSQRFGTNILSGPEDEWKPIIIGNPSGTTRRISLLELGKLSRWTEIRRRNKLGTGFSGG